MRVIGNIKLVTVTREAAHTVAFTNHIALGSIYIICFILSVLKFATGYEMNRG